MDDIRNERLKMRATLLGKAGVGCIIGGFLVLIVGSGELVAIAVLLTVGVGLISVA
jgi:hypothetical protein